MNGSLCIVGPQSPPRHGVTTVNEAVAALARNAGLAPQIFNTSPRLPGRGLLSRLSRLRSLAWAIRRVQGSIVYASVSGGFGVMAERAIVRRAQKRGAQIVLHHHSFNYLDSPTTQMRRLVADAGPEAIHVTLSSNMAQTLRRQYPGVGQTHVVSNAAFLDAPPATDDEPRTECRVIGHLSNLCRDKGLFDIVELAEWSQQNDLDVEFRLAGPFADSGDWNEFVSRWQRLKNLRWLGPLHGNDKNNFLEELDVFLFPTRYRNEAEPLVLLEALSKGCPIISYDRGCIFEIIDPECGMLIPRQESFCPIAAKTLQQWQADPRAHAARRQAAQKKFMKLNSEAAAGREMLLEILAGKRKTT